MSGSIFKKNHKRNLSSEVNRKQQILETAAQVFARLGYSASIDQIAEEMGVTKGHIYYYFSSKQEILFQIFKQAMEFFLAETTAVNTQNLPADQRLKAIFKKHIIAICENRAIMTVFMDLRRDLLPDHWREIAVSRKEYEALLQDLIQEGIDGGYFISENKKILSYTLLGAINWVYVWFQEKGEFSKDEVAEIMSDYLLQGLKRWPSMDIIETGKTVNEVEIGETASYSKTVTDTDICLFAGITGYYNPLQLNERLAGKDSESKPEVHSSIISSLISPVIDMILPGIGGSALETTVRHRAPVYPGDIITASAVVTGINETEDLLIMDLHWFNQDGIEIASGETTVKPPRKERK